MDTNVSPVISVIMPVYNCGEFVGEAITSILRQTFVDFELLVFDDASTDDTARIVESLADLRIQLIKKPVNSGYTSSLNMGLDRAKGKYIARMDGDDISHPDRFAAQVAFLEKHQDIIACGTWFRLTNNGRVIEHSADPEMVKVKLMDYCVLGHPTVMMRNEVIQRLHFRYDPLMEPAEDYNMWTELVSHGRIANVPVVLLDYRVHDKQVSTSRLQVQLRHTESAQIRMLRYLIPEPSEKERQLHLSLIYSTCVTQPGEVEEIIAWADHLDSVNRSVKFYNETFLGELLKEKKKLLIKSFFNNKGSYSFATLLELYRLRDYSFSAFSASELLKLFAKAIIFWKRKSYAV